MADRMDDPLAPPADDADRLVKAEPQDESSVGYVFGLPKAEAVALWLRKISDAILKHASNPEMAVHGGTAEGGIIDLPPVGGVLLQRFEYTCVRAIDEFATYRMSMEWAVPILPAPKEPAPSE